MKPIKYVASTVLCILLLLSLGGCTWLLELLGLTFTVTYDGNGHTGGSVPMDDQSYQNGQTVAILGNTGSLEKSGNIFGGWNTSSDGSGTNRTPGSTFMMGSEDVTLYANWASIDTVTYNGNGADGGSVPEDDNAYLEGDVATVMGNTGGLEKNERTFGGWNTKSDGSGTSYSGGNTIKMERAAVTLYAEWMLLGGVKFEDEETYNTFPAGAPPAGVSESMPSEYDLADAFPVPGSQYNQPSCVAWALAYLKTFQEYEERGWDISLPEFWQNEYNSGFTVNNLNHIFSPAFIYNHIKIPIVGSAFIMTGLDSLLGRGCITWDEMPYDPRMDSTEPTEDELQTALQYRIEGWKKVRKKSLLEDTKAFISSRIPVVIGIKAGYDYVNLNEDNPIYDVPPGKYSNHAVVAIGYSDITRSIKVIDSYGTWSGINGYRYISYDLFSSVVSRAYYTSDLISGVSTPSFSPAGGTFANSVEVTISTSTAGATKRYTTDGSTPTRSHGIVYSTPVTLYDTTTLKAIAYKTGWADSGVRSATFTVEYVWNRYTHEDALISNLAHASWNFGTSEGLYISNSGYTVRSLIDFNVGQYVQPGATVVSAQLRLYVYHYDSYKSDGSDFGSSPMSVSIFPVTGNWAENTVTWNTSPAYSAGSVYTLNKSEGFTGFIHFNVAQIVQYMIDNGLEEGFLIKLQNENTSGVYWIHDFFFRSREFSESDKGPHLSVIYSP